MQRRTVRTVRTGFVAVAIGALAATTIAVPPVGATPQPASVKASFSASADAAFRGYDGATPLADLAPGTVLHTRTLSYRLFGIPLPLSVVQLAFRTTNARGEAVVGVTSVIKAPLKPKTDKVVSYQSFYDSLNPKDGPSYAIAGNVSVTGAIPGVETALIVPFLLQGYAVVTADTQGPTADFAAGPEYGMVTLDSLRAVSNSATTGVAKTARVGLLGYSGGAIATNWAAALAPAYAPDVNTRLVGAAEGGLLVQPAHNLHYVEGSTVWAGIIPMALIGVARAYGIDLRPYLNDYGVSLYDKLQNASIANVLGQYPRLTWAELAKPQYAVPESVPLYVDVVNKVNLGAVASPTVPMFIGQGAGGFAEGTSGSKPGIGAGDGVMIAGDVRSLARQYCSDGTRVKYTQYPLTSHVPTALLFVPGAVAWLGARFGSGQAPSDCASIAPGNPLTPTTLVPAG